MLSWRVKLQFCAMGFDIAFTILLAIQHSLLCFAFLGFAILSNWMGNDLYQRENSIKGGG